MSNGYTSALAKTAPAEPATASPHGGNTSSLEGATIFEDLGPVWRARDGEDPRSRAGDREGS